MKNVIWKIFSINLTLLIIYGQSFAADKNPEVAVLLQGMSNPYWKSLYDGVNDKAHELGIEVYAQGVQSHSDAEGQLNMCNTMLLRQPKAIIFSAVNSVNLAPCLREASEKGIKLVDVDGGTTKETAQKMGVNLSFSVASNNYDLGKKAAQYLKGLNGKVLLIEGYAESVPAKQRAEGFTENIPQGLQVIASLPGNWDRLKAADITNDVMLKHPDLVAIFAANDVMALGAAEALLANNIKTVKVVGVDGNPDAVKAILSGRLTATVAQLPYLMGGQALEKTHKMVSNNRTYEFDQKVPILTLDRDILSKKHEPLLQFVR